MKPTFWPVSASSVLVERDRVFVDLADRVAHVEERQQAGGMPGRARGQLLALDQHDVGPALLGKMIERRDADHAAADHHRARLVLMVGPQRRGGAEGNTNCHPREGGDPVNDAGADRSHDCEMSLTTASQRHVRLGRWLLGPRLRGDAVGGLARFRKGGESEPHHCRLSRPR